MSALLSILFIAAQAAAQGVPVVAPKATPPESPDAPAQSEPLIDSRSSSATPAEEAAEVRASGRFLAPLIPEGGQLIRARGKLGRDDFLGVWTYELSDRVAGASNRSIILLPSMTLGDMVAARAPTASGGVESSVFELSGAILAFKGTNYIIPAFANPLSGAGEYVQQETLRAPGAAPLTPVVPEVPAVAPVVSVVTAEETPSAPVDPESFAAELERRLDTAVPTVPASAVPAAAAPVALSPDLVSPEIAAAPPQTTSAVLPPMKIQSKRGTLTRDPLTGTWRFVFASGHRDEGDIAMDLLPCTVLARLIPQARAASQPHILLTGDIEVYEGRNYLRPIRYQILTAGKHITP